MGSLYKNCPFRKGSCRKDCALYDKESTSGCAILAISKTLEYIGVDLYELKGKLISISDRNRRQAAENEI